MAVSQLTLPTLPTEVVELIALATERSDLLNLRLACKTLSRKTCRVFVQRYFANLRTDLSSKSLQKIHEISQSEHICEHVLCLVISDKPTGEKRVDLGQGFHWPRRPSGRLINPQQIVCVRALQDMLQKCLTNCRSFRIHGSEALELDPSKDDCILPFDVIYIILDIVADTGIHIQSLNLEIHGELLKEREFDVSMCQQPRFQKAWSSIKELRLNCSYPSRSDYGDLITGLITHACSLRALSLRSLPDFGSDVLGLCIISNAIPSSLQELILSANDFGPTTLARLIRPCRNTLRRIEFYGCFLSKGDSWVKVLHHLRDQYPSLESLTVDNAFEGEEGEEKHVIFRPSTHEQMPESRFKTVIFVPCQPCALSTPNQGALSWRNKKNLETILYKDCPPRESITGVRYEGSRMTEALAMIIQSMYLVDDSDYDDVTKAT